MSRQCPCFGNGIGCNERSPGCHATCEDYRDWSQENVAKNERIRKQKTTEHMLNEYGFKTSHKLKKRRGNR